MTATLASGLPSLQSRRIFPAGARNGSFMAGSMQASSDSIAISNTLPATSGPILAGPSDQISFLKASHPRPETHLSSIASAGLRTSPSPGIEGTRPPSSPHMANIAAAGAIDRPSEQDKDREHQRQPSSPHVAREALGAATGLTTDKDQRSQDHANAANTLSEPMDTVARSIQMTADEMQVDHPRSPVADTFGAGDHATTSATLINSSTVASPGPIEETASQDGDRSRHQNEPPEDANKAFSYPMPAATLTDPRRGLSLPNSGFHKGSPRSPSTKKHRCPYCSTEFTRHHNLKSHLLTHSQEKPFVCQTCQSRFRRLHDLKRHTKLHTGERPHICPKCGRRFARGDALARHNKGQGGCAGRRASMGSYGGEEEYGDVGPGGGGEDAMDGLMYTEPERMDEEEERRMTMPSIRQHNAPSTEPGPRVGASGAFPPRGPSTYPPIAASRPPPPGGLFPPATSHGGSSSSTSPISQTGTMSFPPAGHSSSSSYPAPSMTDSPKPLSPNALASSQLGHGPEGGNMHLHQQHRAHSPSLAQQYPQQHYSRTGPAPPSAGTGQTSLGLPPPQLPPPPGLNPPDARYTLHSQAPIPPPSALPAKHAATHSHSSSHGPPAPSQTGGESGPTGPLSGSQDPNGAADQSREDKLWAYIRSVHEELSVLRTEVVALRAQVAATQSSIPQQAPGEGNSSNTGTR
jgi:hypothetical protein